MKKFRISAHSSAGAFGRVAVKAIVCGGAAVCAALPGLAHAQSEDSRQNDPILLHVDCAVAARGDGSEARPYWRITDALKRARHLRRENGERIVIRVAPGACTGNFEHHPQETGGRPPEAFPLVINVPNLTLHGAGVMVYDKGFPIHPRAATKTSIIVDAVGESAIDTTVVYVGPTAGGGRADGAVLEGLSIDGAFYATFGIDISRTQRITLQGNLVEHVNLGAINGSECSGDVIGNVVHDGSPGILFAGGSQNNPSKLYIGGNSATNNYEGLGLFGDSMVTENLDMGANSVKLLPYPINPKPAQVGNYIEAEFEGNDSSNNYVGLRFAMMGGGHYPYSQTGNITVRVHDNRFLDNAGFSFAVDEGFVFRPSSEYWNHPNPDDFPEGYLGSLAAPFVTHGPFDGPYSGQLKGVFEHNVWKNPNVEPVAPAILTFSYIDVYDVSTGQADPGLAAVYKYMQNSRIDLVDRDGLFSRPGVIRDDLRQVDPLDGVTPLNNRSQIHKDRD